MTRQQYHALRQRRFEIAREHASIQASRAYGYGKPAEYYNLREGESIRARLSTDCHREARFTRAQAQRRESLRVALANLKYAIRRNPHLSPDDSYIAGRRADVRAALFPIGA